MSVIAVCQLKSGGSSTLALTLASAAAFAGKPVTIIDASRNGDIARWAGMAGRPREIAVVACRTVPEMESATREALLCRRHVVLDAGTKRDRLRMAARFADIALVPVRFSPLSAYWAVETERLLRSERAFGRPRHHAFVATAIAQIPSRVARAVEAGLCLSDAEKLSAGLALRAAFEAPFQSGGTIYTLGPDAAPGLAKARDDVSALTAAIAAFGRQAAPVIALEREPEIPSWRGLTLAEFRCRDRVETPESRAFLPA